MLAVKNLICNHCAFPEFNTLHSTYFCSNFNCRQLRSDAYDWQYVHDSVEVQVQDAREALETFHRGQKKRSQAATALNAQSSRSHSIFNIRKKVLDPTVTNVQGESPRLVWAGVSTGYTGSMDL